MVTHQLRSRAARLRPDERRAALLAAATELFIARGPDFTTADLAAAAGVSEGTIFRYFPDKEALLDAARDAALDLDGLAPLLAAAAQLPTLAQRLVAAAHALQPRIEQMARVVEQSGHLQRRPQPDDQLVSALLALLSPLFGDAGPAGPGAASPGSDPGRTTTGAAPEQLASLFLGSMLANTVLSGKGGVTPLDVDLLADLFLHGVQRL